MRAMGLGERGGGLLRHGLWWFHGLIALVLIALIPYTKVKHIFTAAASLMFRDPLAAQRLPRIPESQEQPGAAKITDFNWKQLLNLDACTKCGRCHEACPARAVGAPLSPRDVILSLREFAQATLESGAVPAAAELDIHGKAPGQVAMETLWSCRTCMACVEDLPGGCGTRAHHRADAPQAGRDGAMDSAADENAADHPQDRQFLRRVEAQARRLEQVPALRGQGRPQGSGGCAVVRRRLRPRSIRAIKRVSQVFASLLHEAQVDFGILYDGESNAGNDVRRVGEEGLYEVLAAANVNAFASASFKSIVTTDPHSFNTIRNEYPDFGGKYQIEHYTTLAKRLFAQGRLKVTNPLKYRVTFHDPCHLGRVQQGLRCAAGTVGAARLRTRRDGTMQGELLLLRRRRRQDLDPGPGGGREAGTEPDERSRGHTRPRGLCGQLPEGSHHVRGRAQNHRQRGQIRGQGTDRTHSRSRSRAPRRRGAGMKILVAVKQVAALDEDFEIRADGRDIEPDFFIRDLNEWDDFSLEEAVKIKEAAADPVEVIAVSVGPDEADESLRKCLAKGADRAIRVWDAAIEGSDSIAIARLLAAVARRESPHLVFAGVQSSDQSFASTRHRNGRLSRLAARRRGEQIDLCAGSGVRRISARARGRAAA